MTIAVPPLAISLDDPDWTLIRNLGIGLVVVLWLATAYWTFKDARRRIGDPWLVGLATLVGLFPPFLGPIIYMFFRPPEYIQDATGARSRDQGDGGAARPARPALPGLPRESRGLVPRLSRLHHAAAVGLSVVRAAARVAVAGVPVLRRRDPAGLPSLEDVTSPPRQRRSDPTGV